MEEVWKIKKEEREGTILEAAARHAATTPEDKTVAANIDTVSWPDAA